MSNLQKFLFGFALAAVVVGASGGGYWITKQYHGQMQDRLLNDFFAPAQKIEAQYIASQLEDQINGIINILTNTASFPELAKVSGTCTAEQKAMIEQTLVALKENVDYVALIDKNGTVICAPNLPAFVGKSIAEFPHVKEVIATHRTVISRAVVNPLGIKLIAMNVPVFDKKGEFVGILGGAIRLDSLSKQLSMIPAATPSAYNVLNDDDGTILAHPRAEFEMQNIFGETIQKATGADPDLNNIWRRMLNGETGYSFYTFAGDKKIVGYAPARVMDGSRFFTVAVTAKMAEYGYSTEAYLAKSLLANFAILFTAALLMLMIFYLYNRRQAGEGGDQGD
ncbi:MAG: cache domain-containing protein [Candidatus Niyogibacteria bacterium]|nr:cache domain-containing protein [Candidatus Niyogibacteria bacterium]